MVVYVVLIAFGFVLGVCLVFSLLVGFGLVYPPVKKPPGETPEKLLLKFEPVSLAAHDGKRLSGWWLGAAGLESDSNLRSESAQTCNPAVVVLHGYTDCKSSYLDHVRFLAEEGYPCLIYDHRGHGESEAAPCSLGPLEALDARNALDWLGERGHDRVILWGVSMGAATAYLTATNDARVIAVIAESSFLSISGAIRDTLSQSYRLPFWPVGAFGLLIASLLTRCLLFNVDIEHAATGLGARPLLVVSGGADPRMPPSTGERLAKQTVVNKHLVVSGAGHADCWPMAKADYMEHARWLLRQS